jgi:hypothetical protein
VRHKSVQPAQSKSCVQPEALVIRAGWQACGTRTATLHPGWLAAQERKLETGAQAARAAACQWLGGPHAGHCQMSVSRCTLAEAACQSLVQAVPPAARQLVQLHQAGPQAAAGAGVVRGRRCQAEDWPLPCSRRCAGTRPAGALLGRGSGQMQTPITAFALSAPHQAEVAPAGVLQQLVPCLHLGARGQAHHRAHVGRSCRRPGVKGQQTLQRVRVHLQGWDRAGRRAGSSAGAAPNEHAAEDCRNAAGQRTALIALEPYRRLAQQAQHLLQEAGAPDVQLALQPQQRAQCRAGGRQGRPLRACCARSRTWPSSQAAATRQFAALLISSVMAGMRLNGPLVARLCRRRAALPAAAASCSTLRSSGGVACGTLPPAGRRQSALCSTPPSASPAGLAEQAGAPPACAGSRAVLSSSLVDATQHDGAEPEPGSAHLNLLGCCLVRPPLQVSHVLLQPLQQ